MALWEAALQKHPNPQQEKIKEEYRHRERDGRHSYTLPDDKSVRVMRLSDTVLITQNNRVNIRINPFLNKDYTEKRSRPSAKDGNITG